MPAVAAIAAGAGVGHSHGDPTGVAPSSSPAGGTQNRGHNSDVITGATVRVLSGGQADQRQHVGVAHGQQYSTPPPPYNRVGLGVQSAGTPGQQSHQGAGFQGMTVQLTEMLLRCQ